MLDGSRDDPFSSELDSLDILDSGLYEQGGEYEDPEDIEDIESDLGDYDDSDEDDEDMRD